MYTIYTLFFFVAREASQVHIVTYYFSSTVERLLKLSTMYKSSLHRPRNYVDRTWGRSANCILSQYLGVLRLQKLGSCIGKETVSKKIQEPSCEYESKVKTWQAATEPKKKQDVVQVYYYI